MGATRNSNSSDHEQSGDSLRQRIARCVRRAVQAIGDQYEAIDTTLELAALACEIVGLTDVSMAVELIRVLLLGLAANPVGRHAVARIGNQLGRLCQVIAGAAGHAAHRLASTTRAGVRLSHRFFHAGRRRICRILRAVLSALRTVGRQLFARRA